MAGMFGGALQATLLKGVPRLDEAAMKPYRSLKQSGDVDGSLALQKLQNALYVLSGLSPFPQQAGDGSTVLVYLSDYDLGPENDTSADKCYYGEKTKAAVTDLQSNFQPYVKFGPSFQSMTIDGKAGMQTLRLMDSLLQVRQSELNASQDNSQNGGQDGGQ
jgi:hypothetical protein